MGQTVSILHISDLHRSKDGEISNAALLTSLIRDGESYTLHETPRIKSPDLIIVSGDIIRGSTSKDSDSEVEMQYAEGTAFLAELANYFLDGDHDRLIIVPGNHDIQWKYSLESMTKIDSDKVLDDKLKVKSEYLKGAINQHSPIRWSWGDLSFYSIADESLYLKRLGAFASFYDSFYANRTYSLKPDEQFDIFDFPHLKVTIVGFSSCHNNDHLNFVGNIHPECVANAERALEPYRKKGRLILATWHHNTRGAPHETNYMDGRILKNFIEYGISLGFHGHQHRTEIIDEVSDIIYNKKMFIFSAGTLCGGPMELPAGNNRQYNLVEINWEDGRDDLSVVLHTREKTESSLFDNPIWRAGRIDSTLRSHYTLSIAKPKEPNLDSTLIEIDGMINASDYDAALDILLSLDTSDAFVRKFIVECLIATEDFERASEIFINPTNDEEFVLVLNAAMELGNKQEMVRLKTLAGVGPHGPAIRELLKKIEVIVS